ncbi:MAG TPA: 23S rRNA (guanosine(2251)-2'-O)-methyltransferase RlmB, partial [Bacteroidetes bacterium]|nr:23S rRNA (guanosine(2251)-2'-O)-methyltransferase RlmB [Bacteroidota bacterium]
MELLQSDKEVEQVLLQAASTGEAISAIRKICSEKDIPVKTVPPEKLSR